MTEEKTDIKIQPANVSHVDELARIHVHAWKKAYVGIAPQEVLDAMTVDERKKSFLQAIRDKTEETYVGIARGVVIGFVTIGECRDNDADDKIGEIWGIYIAPECWRRGFGTTLTSWALDKLARRSYKRVVLWAFEDNERGAMFYESLGFRRNGGIKFVKKYGGAKIVRYLRVKHHHAERGGFSPPHITTQAHHPVGASLRAHSSTPQSSVVFCGFL